MSSPTTSVGPPKRQKMSQETRSEGDKQQKPPEEKNVEEEQVSGDKTVEDSEQPPKLAAYYANDGSAELNESFASEIDEAPANQQIETVQKPANIGDEGSSRQDRMTPEELDSPEDVSFDTPTKEGLGKSSDEESPVPRPDTPFQRLLESIPEESEDVADQPSLDNLKNPNLDNVHQEEVDHLEVASAESSKQNLPVSEDNLAGSSMPQDDPRLISSGSSEGSEECEEALERDYEPFTMEMPNDDGTMRILNYDELTTKVHNSWFVKRTHVSFRPDFRGDRYNYRHHYIYCEIPEYRLGRFRDNGVPRRTKLMMQNWAPEKMPEYANSQRARQIKERRKLMLENFKNSYLTGGYQLFVNLLNVFYSYDDPMPALEKYFHEERERSSEREVLTKFRSVVEWALRAEELFEGVDEIYELYGNVESATFSQQQCAAILAWMFLSRNSKNHFGQILIGRHQVHVEKLRFMFTYFEKALSLPPGGTVSFRRVRRPEYQAVDMLDIRNDFHVKMLRNDLKIEETVMCTQVDFANSRIGGGVLQFGSVQEEIRFLMCPEMIVSMALACSMSGREAISIVGAQAFSSYSGYSAGLKWQPLKDEDARQNNPILRDHYGRFLVETIAIDALNYKSKDPLLSLDRQIRPQNIEREFVKAFIGFSSQGNFPLPVVSGWWGCGAFCGHMPLKVLIQACAAAKAGRRLWICRFYEDDMADMTHEMFELFKERGISPSQVMQMLLKLPSPTELSKTYVFDVLRDRILTNTTPPVV